MNDPPGGRDGRPEAARDLAALTREKRLAVVGLISAYIHSPDMDEDLVADVVAEFLPTVDDRSDSGVAAVQNAYMNVIAHLLGELARERGEPVGQVWRRTAVELLVEQAGGTGESG
ncbi:hypothetical protein GCM10010156_62660 [Planobispora rosea]|uniref:Uncharacterized protein n=1 Tax=Planobispora rosea TaxID=35762 RepID=A0A8J3S349_PLARO|nr:hypothetical protein [Planobispora rosea]GGS95912.1 hypothetical protein GCM10010156_62660 [Planobispora rosea]GIH87566.1 hypothetical protein Pro02_59740 [Planobispora rosea]